MYRTLMVNPILSKIFNVLGGIKVTVFTLHRAAGEHGLTGLDVDTLRQSIDYFNQIGVRFISIDELFLNFEGLDKDLNYVCFTLDDGYRDQVEHLIPVLLDYQVNPTLFVITDMVDKRSMPWDAEIAACIKASSNDHFDLNEIGVSPFAEHTKVDKRTARRLVSHYAKELNTEARKQFIIDLVSQLSSHEAVQQVLEEYFSPTSWAVLRELQSNGLKIGTHTCSHQPLSMLEDDQIFQELSLSVETLRSNDLVPSKVLCYPIGLEKDINPRVLKIARECGFIGGVTAVTGYVTATNVSNTPFKVPRFSFPNEFKEATRCVSWIEKLRPSNRVG